MKTILFRRHVLDIRAIEITKKWKIEVTLTFSDVCALEVDNAVHNMRSRL